MPAAARSLETLREVGLGYLRLGQPATELSGGEAQRIKLATELQRARRGHALYLLDEPTSGLHPADIALLLRQLHRLVDAGNTVVLVEHDLDVIATADWVIDLGPGGGDAGGRVVATGTPADVAQAEGSATAPYLARRLDDLAVRDRRGSAAPDVVGLPGRSFAYQGDQPPRGPSPPPGAGHRTVRVDQLVGRHHVDDPQHYPSISALDHIDRGGHQPHSLGSVATGFQLAQQLGVARQRRRPGGVDSVEGVDVGRGEGR